MTNIQKWEPVAEQQTHAVMRLVDWAQEADAAYEMSKRLTTTAFCPESFRGKPADAAAAMLAGGELGLSPMASLSAFDVISGRAAARAITLRALVQSKGHDIELIESTATRCKMQGRRRGTQNWQQVIWTLDRAKDLGVTGKDNWRKQPQTMLVARATAELCRLVAADAILGIAGGISSEEISDGAESSPVMTTTESAEPAATPGRRRMSRPQPALAAEPEPEPEDEPQPEPEDEHPADDSRPITRAQSVKMHAGFTDRKYTRDQGLAFIAQVIGFAVESSKDLEMRDASAVIDAMERGVELDA